LYSNLWLTTEFKLEQITFDELDKKFKSKRMLDNLYNYESRKLFNSIYKKTNEIGKIFPILEHIRYRKMSYEYDMLIYEKIKIINSKSTLSSIYDCKALIESKRDNIPPTFENNRKLIKILKIIEKSKYSNLKCSLLLRKSSYSLIIQELFFICLEYILDNLSEIETTRPHGIEKFEEKCREIYNVKEYKSLGYTFSNYILEIIN
jgi:hypothetical protein